MNIVHLCDCMEFMKGIPDKYYELAIVDPPYGLGDKLCVGGRKTRNRMREMYLASAWEDVAPPPEYFDELFRVSQNQIIWGGNYFSLPPTRGIVVWDKMKFASNYSQIEYAWSSFDCVARLFQFCSNGGFVVAPHNKKIHPTQKPIELYKWLLKNYAKPNDKIFDSHVGSGSIRIACHDMGFDFEGCEIDKDYWEAQENRYNGHAQQGSLFSNDEIQENIFSEGILI